MDSGGLGSIGRERQKDQAIMGDISFIQLLALTYLVFVIATILIIEYVNRHVIWSN